MTNLKTKLTHDINGFFQEIENMDDYGKKEALRVLIDRYIMLSTTDLVMTKKDLYHIKSMGVDLYRDRAWPKNLKNKAGRIDKQDATGACWIEATIAFLNGNDCFKNFDK